MATKEIVMAFTLWLVAAFGFGNNKNEQINVNLMKTRVPAASQQMRTAELNNPAPSVLGSKFAFDQRDEKVVELQQALGIYVDGHYGKFTRRAHLKALEAAGMDTSIVPARPQPLVSDKAVDYDIPSDPEQRCPEFEPLFAKYGLEPVEVFSYIAYRESRCNPKAANAKFDSKGNVVWTLNKDGSIDRGLLQINSCWRTVTKNVCGTGLEGLFNVDCNLKVAKYIMDNSSGGLENWSVWANRN